MKISIFGIFLLFFVFATPFAIWAQTPVLPKIEKARTTGEWRWEASTGLRLQPNPALKNSFWTPNASLSPFGVLSATFVLGTRSDFSFFFRATFPQNIDEVDGYSVSLTRRNLQVHRWEGGFAMPTTETFTLPHDLRSLTLQIDMGESHVRIFALNPENLTVLTQFTLDDLSHFGAQTGFRVYQKQDETTALLEWTFSPDPTPPDAKPTAFSLDAYVRQHPYVFAIAQSKDALKRLNDANCSPVRPSIIPSYSVYRCKHESFMLLMSHPETRQIDDDILWTEPRAAFTDPEYRKNAARLACPTPMRCDDQKLDPNSHAKDADMVQAYLDAYADICQTRVRHVRLETIGTTYLGHTIRALVLTNASKNAHVPKVLFNGSHHGMELLSADFAFDILEQICESDDKDKNAYYRRLLKNTEIWVLPVVNLDGLDCYFHISNHLGRKNGRNVFPSNIPPNPSLPKRYHAGFSVYSRYRPNGIRVGSGVDINRNYPLHWGNTGEISSSNRPRSYWYRGEYPASEPETQAMMNLFHVEQFAASMSFHTVSTRILSPYSIDALNNPPHEEDYAWQMALKMSQAAGQQPNGKNYEVVKNIYSVDGTDQDWFRMIAGTYAYLLEGPIHNPVGEKRRKALTSTRRAWETLLEFSQSATVARVQNTDGIPLVARVEYSDLPALNHEVWLTRPSDGTHTMLCHKKRTITVTLPDGTSQTQQVSCKKDRVTIADFTFTTNETNPYNALCHFGFCTTPMFGTDALCDLQAGTLPHLPSQRYCISQSRCLPTQTSFRFGQRFSWTCQPREQHRFDF